MSYYDELKTAKWKRKTHEIMQRDNYKCVACGNTNELQVHHLYYIPKLKPYEYDNDGLVTVCKECHEALTNDLPKLAGIIAFKILSGKLD